MEAVTTHVYINLLCRLTVFDVRKRGPDVAVARCGCLSMTMVEPSILTKKNKTTYLPTRLAPQVKHTLKIRISECVRSDFV